MVNRPRRFDGSITTSVAECIVGPVMDWLGDKDEDRSMVLARLVVAIDREDDAYKIARRLDESEGWNPDYDLVQVFNNVKLIRSGFHRDAIEKWVKENDVTVPFVKGDEVSYIDRYVGRETVTGEVTEVYASIASCGVVCEQVVSGKDSWSLVEIERLTKVT